MCGVALVPRGRFGPSRKPLEGMKEKNRHTNLQVQARAALVPLKRGVGELLVVDLIDGAVDEHGRGHQRRRREGLPLVGRSPRDNMHDARRRRVGRAPPCVLAPPCVRTVMRNVHRRRCPRRLACSAYCRHRWRMCLLASQNRVQSRQLLQRRSNDSCRARCGWRIHLCVAARRPLGGVLGSRAKRFEMELLARAARDAAGHTSTPSPASRGRLSAPGTASRGANRTVWGSF